MYIRLTQSREFIYMIQIMENLLKTLRVNYVLIKELKCSLRYILKTITS